MGKYRKKPVVVEAEQWFRGRTVAGVEPWDAAQREYGVKTLEGWLQVFDGDWIITGIKGEKYPCKPDIFGATYEAVDEPAGPGGKP